MREEYISTVNGLGVVANRNGDTLFVIDLFDEQDRFLIDQLDTLKRYLLSVTGR